MVICNAIYMCVYIKLHVCVCVKALYIYIYMHVCALTTDTQLKIPATRQQRPSQYPQRHRTLTQAEAALTAPSCSSSPAKQGQSLLVKHVHSQHMGLSCTWS